MGFSQDLPDEAKPGADVGGDAAEQDDQKEARPAGSDEGEGQCQDPRACHLARQEDGGREDAEAGGARGLRDQLLLLDVLHHATGRARQLFQSNHRVHDHVR